MPPQPGTIPLTPQVSLPVGPITSWRAPGAQPLADGEAAARVWPAPENRAANTPQNEYRPTAGEIDAFRHGHMDAYGRTAVQSNALAAHVTGGYAGTTDEILQWAAHKWGVPEDVLRAVAVTESTWRQSALGNRAAVRNPDRYPAHSRIPGTNDVYQSLGITQIRWTPEGLHAGTEPLRWKSTAFNADYWGAVVRYYYDGRCNWCGGGYGAGQSWPSVGAWFNPSPWSGAGDYVGIVSGHLARRTWAMPGF